MINRYLSNQSQILRILGWCLLWIVGNVACQAAESGRVLLRFGGPSQADQVSPPVDIPFDQVSHQTWDWLLRKYVDCHGMVCYSEWQDSCCDVNRLQAYIHLLTTADPTIPSSKDAQMAYHINAYNALAVWGILHQYPVTSIQRIDGKRTKFAIFEDLQLWVGDQYLSLNDIENNILRPLGDLRIHFALVCAAKGCPRLRNHAYTAEMLHAQLDDNAREFFSDRNRFHVSRLTRTVKMSPILKWYREDFGQTDYDVVSSVFPYLPAEDRQWLSCHPGWKFEYQGYNWGLNDQCPTLGVALAAGPYKAWSKMSPKVEPLLNKIKGDSQHSAPDDCACGGEGELAPTQFSSDQYDPYGHDQPYVQAQSQHLLVPPAFSSEQPLQLSPPLPGDFEPHAFAPGVPSQSPPSPSYTEAPLPEP
ncbi:MAG: DUF547 domain-containing protein [Planctomycetaceae bacterium]|nr:DUF547 domain-containing protein [Planctomycetaceae bacterium]